MSTCASSFLALLALVPCVQGQGPVLPATFPDLPMEIGGETVVFSPIFKRSIVAPARLMVVKRLTHERDGEQSPWKSEHTEHSVSWFLTASCARDGGDDLFLAGMKENGQCIVERWRFFTPHGRYRVRYTGTAPPIGTPAGPYTPEVTVAGGGPWTWTTKIKPPGGGPNPQREVLYEGSAGPFTAMAVDPEGRYLVAHDHEEHALLRLTLPGPSTWTTLYTSSAYPDLAQVSSIEVRDFHDAGARALLLRRMWGDDFPSHLERYGVIADSNNDGVFSNPTFYSSDAFLASPYGVWADWRLFYSVE